MTENTRSHFLKRIAMIMALALLVVAAGCKKKVPPPPPLPPNNSGGVTNPNEGGRPVISSFTAEPRTIARGQSSTLRWSISGATDMNIDQGIGPIQSSGSRQVFPSTTTTYTMVANGPGGTDTRSVTVEVSTPPPPPPTGDGPRINNLPPGAMLEQQGQDAYFDYDKADIRPDAADALRRDADLLKQIFQQAPNIRIIVEGHCDERGST
ncbi:MAG TPA: OmpA family protein, partial [Chloroflexota bacterium]|nr:OmpA family protein [Chloroflexota bacterium]